MTDRMHALAKGPFQGRLGAETSDHNQSIANNIKPLLLLRLKVAHCAFPDCCLTRNAAYLFLTLHL